MALVVSLRVLLTFLEEIFVTCRTCSEDVVMVQHTFSREVQVTLHKRCRFCLAWNMG